MPSRMIRGDNLLESARYMALPADLKVFYVHILCAADDFGLLSLAPLIVRKLFSGPVSPERVLKLAKALEEADLVRIYEVGGVFYLFVPRFSQRLKKFTSRCPMPQPHIFNDDEHAVENFKKYKDQFKNMAAPSGGPYATSRNPSPEVEVKRSEEKRSGSEGSAVTGSGTDTTPPPEAQPPFEKESKGNGKTLHERAAAIGITQGENEPRNLFMLRVASEEAKARTEA